VVFAFNLTVAILPHVNQVIFFYSNAISSEGLLHEYITKLMCNGLKSFHFLKLRESWGTQRLTTNKKLSGYIRDALCRLIYHFPIFYVRGSIMRFFFCKYCTFLSTRDIYYAIN
jgi:hypothetical protein